MNSEDERGMWPGRGAELAHTAGFFKQVKYHLASWPVTCDHLVLRMGWVAIICTAQHLVKLAFCVCDVGLLLCFHFDTL